jgi:hypothetical protein
MSIPERILDSGFAISEQLLCRRPGVQWERLRPKCSIVGSKRNTAPQSRGCCLGRGNQDMVNNSRIGFMRVSKYVIGVQKLVAKNGKKEFPPLDSNQGLLSLDNNTLRLRRSTAELDGLLAFLRFALEKGFGSQSYKVSGLFM